MKRHILAALFLTTALPLSSMAQTASDSNAAAGTQPMAGQTGAASDSQATGTQATGTQATDTQASGTQAADTQAVNTQGANGPFVTVPSTGAWRVSDLQGKPVYGTDGLSIGDINDVLISKDGSVSAVIIGVGGFLGIGEKDVAVNTTALQLGPGATKAEADAASKAQADAAAATTNAAANGTAAATGEAPANGGMAPSPSDMSASSAANGDNVTTGTTATTADANNAAGRPAEEANAVQIGDDALPNRIILNVTRDQLEKAPEFKGVGQEAQNNAEQPDQQ